MGKAILGFLFVFVILGITFSGLIIHEATHLILSGEPKGVCFGVCKTSSGDNTAGIAYHNGELTGEFLPNYFGFIAMFTGLFIMVKSFKELSK